MLAHLSGLGSRKELTSLCDVLYYQERVNKWRVVIGYVVAGDLILVPCVVDKTVIH